VFDYNYQLYSSDNTTRCICVRLNNCLLSKSVEELYEIYCLDHRVCAALKHLWYVNLIPSIQIMPKLYVGAVRF